MLVEVLRRLGPGLAPAALLHPPDKPARRCLSASVLRDAFMDQRGQMQMHSKGRGGCETSNAHLSCSQVIYK